MIDRYFTLIAFTWALAQTLKFLIKVSAGGRQKLNLKHMRQTYMYLSGIPSAHSAVLTANFFYMRDTLGSDNPLFYILTLFSYLWLFEIYMQRRRYRSSSDFFAQLLEKTEDLLNLKDLSGHELIDILAGFVVGTLSYSLITNGF